MFAIFTARVAKVMFSQVFVILSLKGGGVGNTKGQPPPPPGPGQNIYPPPPPPPPPETTGRRAVRILLECILVCVTFCHPLFFDEIK